MFIVAKTHTVSLSQQVFKSGERLPDNRDYSALIDLGVVEKVAKLEPIPPIDEPSIVTITKEKVKKKKKTQLKAKNKRVKDKKKANEIIEPTIEPPDFTVEGGG